MFLLLFFSFCVSHYYREKTNKKRSAENNLGHLFLNVKKLLTLAFEKAVAFER